MPTITHQGIQRLNPLLGDSGYRNKVLSYNPLAYEPLDEQTGSVAIELVNGWNGTYVGATVGAGIGPDGQPCPFFDGINDYVNILAGGLSDAFPWDEGSVSLWARVFDVGCWTDGTNRFAFWLRQNWDNYFDLRKRSSPNETYSERYGAGVGDENVRQPFSETDWFHWVLTWSVTENELIEYNSHGDTLQDTCRSAADVGATLCAVLGTASVPPTTCWHGWLAHFAIFPGPVSAQVAEDLHVL